MNREHNTVLESLVLEWQEKYPLTRVWAGYSNMPSKLHGGPNTETYFIHVAYATTRRFSNIVTVEEISLSIPDARFESWIILTLNNAKLFGTFRHVTEVHSIPAVDLAAPNAITLLEHEIDKLTERYLETLTPKLRTLRDKAMRGEGKPLRYIPNPKKLSAHCP